MRKALTSPSQQFDGLLNLVRRAGGTWLPKTPYETIIEGAQEILEFLAQSGRNDLVMKQWDSITSHQFFRSLAFELSWNKDLQVFNQETLGFVLKTISASEEFYPIGLIGFDYNKLKRSNFRYGSEQSDRMLNTTAVIIENTLYTPRELNLCLPAEDDQRQEQRLLTRIVTQVNRGDEMFAIIPFTEEQRSWPKPKLIEYLWLKVSKIMANLSSPEAAELLVVQRPLKHKGRKEIVNPSVEAGVYVIESSSDTDPKKIWGYMEKHHIQPAKLARSRQKKSSMAAPALVA